MAIFAFTPQLSARLSHGPLSGVVPTYVWHLSEQGYTERSSENFFCLLANLNEWLHRRQLQVSDLTEKTVDQYLKYRNVHFRTLHDDRSILRRILRLLQDEGLLETKTRPLINNPHQGVEADYDRYLSLERGLAASTRLNYRGVVHCFLQAQSTDRPVSFAALRPAEVLRIVREEASHLSPQRAGLMVTALRSFFSYLQQRGEIRINLAACVPGIPSWTLAPLPSFLHAHQVRHVLRQCDRRTSHGRRDHAILLLLARLGLRACEVVRLTLDDINWRSGEITICGKGNRTTRLPLPPDVGQTIAMYLKKGRPPCSTRQVFVCLRAPRRGFVNSAAVSTIVARRLKQGGFAGPHTGAHLFRHTLATQMLRSGASFADIAHLLRHRSFNTTALYAKVDLSSLRRLAQPWPEGGQQ